MIDFLLISTRSNKRGVVEIYPKFIIKKSSDLMIRGRDFYAIWMDELGVWSTEEQDALQLIDKELDKYAEENKVFYYFWNFFLRTFIFLSINKSFICIF